jgi:hypothetical protein
MFRLFNVMVREQAVSIPSKRQQKAIMDGLSNPMKKMVITSAAEGATNHNAMENRILVGHVLFDWLDDVFR